MCYDVSFGLGVMAATTASFFASRNFEWNISVFLVASSIGVGTNLMARHLFWRLVCYNEDYFFYKDLTRYRRHFPPKNQPEECDETEDITPDETTDDETEVITPDETTDDSSHQTKPP